MNMNIPPNKKYSLAPEEVERKALRSERFRTACNRYRLENVRKFNLRQDGYDKKYDKKRKKLREDLYIGEKVYVLAERIKKKSAPGNVINNQCRTLPMKRSILT